MKIASLLGADADREALQNIAAHFEEAGWEVYSPVRGVGNTIERNDPRNYLSPRYAAIFVLMTIAVARNPPTFLQPLLNVIERKQTNIVPISGDSYWLKFPEFDNMLKEYSCLENQLSDFVAFDSHFQSSSRTFREALERVGIESLFQAISGGQTLSLLEQVREKAISYDIYERKDVVSDRTDYLIALFEGANITKSAAHYKENYGSIVKQNPATVVRVTSIGDLSPTQIRNLEDKFNAKAWSFKALVASQVPDSASQDAVNQLGASLSDDSIFIDFGCLHNENTEPVAVFQTLNDALHETRYFGDSGVIAILGSGGGGKSWLARNLNTDIVRSGQQLSVFIDPKVIRRARQSMGDVKIESLYDVYGIYMGALGMVPETRELFYLRLDTHPSVIFVDGIEEIRAALSQSFSIDAFFADCIRMTEQSEQTKIVITSRFKFWDNAQRDKIDVYKLESFSPSNIESYLSRAYPLDDSSKKEVYKTIQSLHNGEAINITPAMLITVCELVNRQTHGIQITDMDSDYLSMDVPWDYLIASLINRDREKLSNDWSLDEWLRIFAELAANLDGSNSVKASKLTEIASSIKGRQLIADESISLSDHVLLTANRGDINFNGEYYLDYFRAMYIRMFLERGTGVPLEKSEISVFTRNIIPGSDASQQLLEWYAHDPELLAVPLAEIAEAVRADTLNVPRHMQNELVGSAFSLALEAYIAGGKSGSVDDILSAFFERDGSISQGVFVGFNNSRLSDVKFDLRGRVISRCRFREFDGLWWCATDESTKWVQCAITACKPPIKPQKHKEYGIFDGCTFDDEVEVFLQDAQKGIRRNSDQIKDEIKNILATVTRYGNLSLGKVESEILDEYRSRLNISAKKMLKMLTQEEILEERKHKGSSIILLHIKSDAREACSQFMETRQVTGKITKLYRAIDEALK